MGKLWVEGIDAPLPSILSKEVCQRCMINSRTEWSQMRREWVPAPWTSEDERYWNIDLIQCPTRRRREHKRFAQINCEFNLEHIVSQGQAT